ncbi:MAG: aspartate--tRNA ligase [Gammaproteobacteria bacterium]|nr:aspartate--tRNA ligase [Gammaproteobacteria bacterium]
MRTHYCGVLRKDHIDQRVELCGWVHRRRDHGGVIFLDLRDHRGLVQVVFNPDTVDAFEIADDVRSEYVVQIEGRVRARLDGATNPDLATGEIEVLGDSIKILNRSRTIPFPLNEYSQPGEDIRLRYRYVDLRRPEMQSKLRLRSRVSSFIRRFLEAEDFVDVETPTLTKATPEGARDYIVPSRTQQGRFFALPQSPQLFKQMLMMAGMDRYYQIARCYRDEDLRHDRQPEFTQIDIEASFVEPSDVMSITERMLEGLFRETLGIELGRFPVLTYAQAMDRYGSDKPDLRNPLELIDVDEIVKDCEFAIFRTPANDPEGRVAAINVPGAIEALSRKQLDDLVDYVQAHGAKGLAYVKVNDLESGMEGLQSPILKFLDQKTIFQILEKVEAQRGDIVFFGADRSEIVNDSLGRFRNHVADLVGIERAGFKPCWVVEWPMFEKDGNGLSPAHHPFTQPACDIEKLREKPAEQLAHAYDIVVNGYELGGGSIRIHDPEMQNAVFDVLEMGQEASAKFGFLLEALELGCPPHGGIALGLDRLIMIMIGTDSIRDVVAFPKTQSAACLLTSAPSEVDRLQLRELGLQTR